MTEAVQSESAETRRTQTPILLKRIPTADVGKLVLCLGQLQDLGHSGVEDTKVFLESLDKRLAKEPTSPIGPLVARLPQEILHETRECIAGIVECGITCIPDISMMVSDAKVKLNNSKSIPRRPDEVSANPRTSQDANVIKSATSDTEYEWHADAERAFDGDYTIDDCDVCAEMICSDTFMPHWANGLAPEGAEKIKGDPSVPRVVKETTTVTRSQDDAGNKRINEYTCISELGKGAFGKVKLVIHTGGEYFAIKILDKTVLAKIKNGMGGKSALDDALTEIALLKLVQHRNICSLFEVIDDQENGKLYLIIDYYEKGPVYDLEKTQTPLPVERIKTFAIGICQGLDYLHENNVLHRDIKPANILVDADDQAVLTDFGVAHFVEGDGSRCVSDTVGTPAFFTPEQINRQGINGRLVDIWAMGVTLYILAYGKLPFQGAAFPELAVAITDTEPPLDGCDDPELVSLIKGILTKDPSKRLGHGGAKEILKHPWLSSDSRAAIQEHPKLMITESDKENAVTSGHNIVLKLGNTVGVMLQVQGAIKGFMGLASPKGDSPAGLIFVSDHSNNDSQPSSKANPQLGTKTSECGDDSSDSDGEAPPSRGGGSSLSLSNAPLAPKKSFRTEEEVILEDTTASDLLELISKAKKTGEPDLVVNCIKIDNMPEQLFQCTKLQSVTCHSNGLCELPSAISNLKNLTSLSLLKNDLTALPDTMGEIPNLKLLNCAHNKLSSLPISFSKLESLETINLDYNLFTNIPISLCSIVGLKKCYMIANEGIKSFPQEGSGWAGCQVAVTNTPVLCEWWSRNHKKFKKVDVLWNKSYPDKVTDHVFLGSLRTAQSEKIFRQLNITKIVTAGKGLQVLDPLPEGVEQILLNVDDQPDQKLAPFFDDVADFLEKSTLQNERVLVHCFAGLSRSAAVVCAYLIKKRKMTFKQAIQLVKVARPSVNPNDGFRKQLIEYEHILYGTRLATDDIENHSNGPTVDFQ